MDENFNFTFNTITTCVYNWISSANCDVRKMNRDIIDNLILLCLGEPLNMSMFKTIDSMKNAGCEVEKLPPILYDAMMEAMDKPEEQVLQAAEIGQQAKNILDAMLKPFM